ncbi:hypothetical protein [Streptomyces sp. WAC06614]|uniref:hypothetical protein n=1 Tax=Streptomyces sp. WAC06614 TaxID=2487416 RepID=UPI000F7B68F2|nr:hypothetical protein [Streptomyces sp. WAC06614]RSS78233.1 hypothetical protein EF918_21705 [Streptomyces sp. WAC06614]
MPGPYTDEEFKEWVALVKSDVHYLTEVWPFHIDTEFLPIARMPWKRRLTEGQLDQLRSAKDTCEGNILSALRDFAAYCDTALHLQEQYEQEVRDALPSGPLFEASDHLGPTDQLLVKVQEFSERYADGMEALQEEFDARYDALPGYCYYQFAHFKAILELTDPQDGAALDYTDRFAFWTDRWTRFPMKDRSGVAILPRCRQV